MRSFSVLALLLASQAASADVSWHAGGNIRTEFGTHPIRVGGGARFDRWSTTLVLDPMFWTDGQVDTDLLVTYAFGEGAWGVLAGWRTTAIPLVDSRQWHQKLLVGLDARVPGFSFGRVGAKLGIELSTVIVKHGGGLPSDLLSFGEPGGYLDFVNFAMFLRFDYES